MNQGQSRSDAQGRRGRGGWAGLVLLMVMLMAPAGYAKTFSWAVLADGHVGSDPNKEKDLRTAVEWIKTNKDAKAIGLVLVVGDIGLCGGGAPSNLARAKGILDGLNEAGAPYVPIIGDNEVQGGCVEQFEEVFAPQYEYLAGKFPNFKKAAVAREGLHLQNFAFDYDECHFVCPDFISRKKGVEGGELHEGKGGTWEWFKQEVAGCGKAKQENIIILTHIGMFQTWVGPADRYLFSGEQMKQIREFLFPYRKYVAANYAGHIHCNWHAEVWAGFFEKIYDVWVTDKTWNYPGALSDSVTVRWVEVNTDGEVITYRQHIVNARQGN